MMPSRTPGRRVARLILWRQNRAGSGITGHVAWAVAIVDPGTHADGAHIRNGHARRLTVAMREAMAAVREIRAAGWQVSA